MDINKKAICDLRAEIDSLKMQVHKVNAQIEEANRENNTLKRMCENREHEINTLIESNRELEKSN
jgi:peptidoglycan hydrolase CwlO-like protein